MQSSILQGCTAQHVQSAQAGIAAPACGWTAAGAMPLIGTHTGSCGSQKTLPYPDGARTGGHIGAGMGQAAARFAADGAHRRRHIPVGRQLPVRLAHSRPQRVAAIARLAEALSLSLQARRQRRSDCQDVVVCKSKNLVVRVCRTCVVTGLTR